MMQDTDEVTKEEELRKRAIERLKKKHDFRGHLLVYTLVNTFVVDERLGRVSLGRAG
jgi:hypothetical protein